MTIPACTCDGESVCEAPACVAAAAAEMEYYRQMYAGSPPRMSREEWDSVYADDLGKCLAYPW